MHKLENRDVFLCLFTFQFVLFSLKIPLHQTHDVHFWNIDFFDSSLWRFKKKKSTVAIIRRYCDLYIRIRLVYCILPSDTSPVSVMKWGGGINATPPKKKISLNSSFPLPWNHGHGHCKSARPQHPGQKRLHPVCVVVDVSLLGTGENCDFSPMAVLCHLRKSKHARMPDVVCDVSPLRPVLFNLYHHFAHPLRPC